MSEQEDTYLTVTQVCELLHISKVTLYRWVKEGRISAIKVGQKLLFEKREIQKLIDEGRIK